MNRNFTQKILSSFLFFFFGTLSLLAQVTVGGRVVDNNGASAPNLSVVDQKSGVGTHTDDQGNFSLRVASLPTKVIISGIGYAKKIIDLVEPNTKVVVGQTSIMQNEVVVGASRSIERLLEAPVSIEKMSATQIKNQFAPNFYDGLGNFKGIDMNTASVLFQTFTTRGFGGSGNLRLIQLVDGMDNQAPGLNFSVGNIAGIPEIDMESAELIQGASSALYGSGGMNGALLLTSKNPFTSEGLSAQVKSGYMVQDATQFPKDQYQPFYDVAVRYAKKVNDKLAFKVSVQYVRANDWRAYDSSNLTRNNINNPIKGGTRASDNNYDGVNVYGDEATANMQAVAKGVLASKLAGTALAPAVAGGAWSAIATALGSTSALYPFAAGLANPTLSAALNQSISRTGYSEASLVNNDQYNLKVTGSVNYKIAPTTELSLSVYHGAGSTIYTANDRYSLKDFNIQQIKLELKAKTGFLRAYTTLEDAGDSYNTTVVGLGIENKYLDHNTWFATYVGNYIGGLSAGMNDAAAQAFARGKAEVNRFAPGSAGFKQVFDSMTSTPIKRNGAKFDDKSSLLAAEGMYNFSEYVKNVVDLSAGFGYKQYTLNSGGNLFSDTTGRIVVSEYGAYVQAQKKFFEDVLKISFAGRVDGHTNFDPKFTPRVSALVALSENNYLRASFQTAYRFPSNQDQYIDLLVPGTRLIGGLQNSQDRYNLGSNLGYTAASVIKYQSTGNTADLVKDPYAKIKPESNQTYEVGYKGLIENALFIDAYYYYSSSTDFLTSKAISQAATGTITDLKNPATTNNYNYKYNSSTKVDVSGWGISLDYRFEKALALSANFSEDRLVDEARVLAESPNITLNAAGRKANFSVTNNNIFHNVGAGLHLRWQDEARVSGAFGGGTLPAYTTLDAQLTYAHPLLKYSIKLAGTNILNQSYITAYGNPTIGAMFYISLGYNL